MTTLTKAKLAKRLHDRIGFTKTDAGDMVDEVLAVIEAAILEGEKVKISGFGNFEVRHKDARRGRNPQTGESITLEERRVLTFKPSQRLREALNNNR